MTEVWCLHIDEVDQEGYEDLWKSVPNEIQHELKRYKRIKDRKLKLMARLMVAKYHQSKGVDFTWDLWKLSNHKKPWIEGGSHFNISHSGNYVVVVFSDTAVGIDIEQIMPIQIEGLLKNLHQQERYFIETSVDKVKSFYYVWTRKEAYLKSKGIGLLEGMNVVNCLQRIIHDDTKNRYLNSISLFENYELAICSENSKEVKESDIKHKKARDCIPVF